MAYRGGKRDEAHGAPTRPYCHVGFLWSCHPGRSWRNRTPIPCALPGCCGCYLVNTVHSTEMSDYEGQSFSLLPANQVYQLRSSERKSVGEKVVHHLAPAPTILRLQVASSTMRLSA